MKFSKSQNVFCSPSPVTDPLTSGGTRGVCVWLVEEQASLPLPQLSPRLEASWATLLVHSRRAPWAFCTEETEHGVGTAEVRLAFSVVLLLLNKSCSHWVGVGLLGVGKMNEIYLHFWG